MRSFIVIGLIVMLFSGCVEEADFEVTELLVSASEVESGDSVVIWIEVENNSDETGTYKIELMIDDTLEESLTVTIEKDESEIVSSTVIRTQIKSYVVSVEDLSTSFSVVEPVEEKLPELEEVPESYKLPVPVVNTTIVMPEYFEDEGEWEETFEGGLCYIASFGMIVLYNDSQLDFSDVIAYSGVGTTVNCGPQGIGIGYGMGGIINAADNLGYELALGIGDGGVVGHDFESEEVEATFSNQSEAFNYLASTIASDTPAMVHLDTYYVRDDLAKVTFKWAMNDKAHTSHFMVVTGYDYNSGCVYLNDNSGYTAEEGVDMPTTIGHFLNAWENGANTTWGAKLGPYWMLYIKGSSSRKSTAEIKSWNKEISESTASHIQDYASGSPIVDSLTYLAELAVARKEFAAFLENTQNTEAASLYEEASELYQTMPSANDLAATLNEIADLEEDARELY